MTDTVIPATREGEWLPVEELRTAALSTAQSDGRLIVNLCAVEHLQGEALQILLALAAERRKQGRPLVLAEFSEGLVRWFEYAGARESLLPEHKA